MTDDSNKLPTSAQNEFDRTLTSGATSGASVEQIGPYKLLQRLGEGGMGEVWLAEQSKPIHRTVALKLIKTGMDTKAVVARFESERQALALMDHLNIARVFDAGATPEGRPYFVMEYVPGTPITEYCDKHKLSIAQRLELFLQVCDGVQHAHQKAIIHRDLKPSNVLVVQQGDKSIPKIIDFGLAKATAQRLTEHTMFTELGVMVGTPEYMSPEQADMNEHNIDTRTDVYSLGVILYQLLVGVLPFESKELRAAGLEAVLRVIREQEPTKPSTKIRMMAEASASAEKRQEALKSFARHLKGELDWITMKALEKDRSRRYGSPADLSADIQRHLRNDPVVAGPPTAAYRASKFVRRHRFGVATAAVATILLVAFAATMAVQARRIARERDRANREAAASERVSDFMIKMFKVSDPSESRGNSVTAREILDKASSEVDTGLAKDPQVQARMMYTMARVYDELGLYKAAEPLAKRSFEISEKAVGAEGPETLNSKMVLARVAEDESRPADAEKLYRGVADARRRTLGPENSETLRAESSVAWVVNEQGRYAEAEKLNRELLETAKKRLGESDAITQLILQRLAIDLAYQGKLQEAEQMFRDGLRVDLSKLPPDHPDIFKDKENIANTLLGQNKLGEAEGLDREVLEAEMRIYGPEHPSTLLDMGNLALILRAEKRYAEAEKLFRDTLEIKTRTLGAEHRSTLLTLGNLAETLRLEKRTAEAEKILRDLLAVERRTLGARHFDTMITVNSLAMVLQSENHFAEAEQLSTEVFETKQRLFGPDHPETASAAYDLGCLLALDHKPEQALERLKYAVEHGLTAPGDLHMESDTDLQSLRGLPGFTELVAEARQRAAAQTANATAKK